MTERIFESGVKLFYLGIESFGLGVNTASGQVDWNCFVVYTDEEKVDFREEMPTTAFVRVIAGTHPDCTGVGKKPDVCMGLSDMPYV